MLSRGFPAFAVLAILALACGAVAPAAAPTSAPPPEAAATATQGPSPTPTPVPPTATPEVQEYFTEEFDEGMDHWTTYVVDGNNGVLAEKGISAAHVEPEDGALKFDLQDNWLWAYTVYEPFDYDDVRVDASFENQGTNNNNISLVCRYVEGEGWYEFNIANNGLYWIYNAEPRSDGYVRYKLLQEGGSNSIKQGHEVNEYSIICDGSTLTLFINGKKTKELTDTARSSGKVGVSVSSFDSLPVFVNVEWVKISPAE